MKKLHRRRARGAELVGRRVRQAVQTTFPAPARRTILRSAFGPDLGQSSRSGTDEVVVAKASTVRHLCLVRECNAPVVCSGSMRDGAP